MATLKSRGILIAGNWKMNHSLKETEGFFSEIKALTTQGSPILDAEAIQTIESGKVQACLIPPMLSLQYTQTLTQGVSFPLSIACQNAHWEKKGAFTGEVSGPMLQEIGISTVLVGHSERRQYFGETDESVRKRTESLLAQGFKVILCIGETRAEREQNQTQEVLKRQLQGALPEANKGAASYLNGQLVFAYEPVWAIGTGLTATPAQAEEAHQFIRELMIQRFGTEAAQKTPILYGGSVTPENIDSLLACANVDGALVGGASLKPEGFLRLLASGCTAV